MGSLWNMGWLHGVRLAGRGGNVAQVNREFAQWFAQYRAPIGQTGLVRFIAAVEAAWRAGREAGILEGKKELDKLKGENSEA